MNKNAILIKLLALVLSFSLLMTVLSGCGDNVTESTNEPTLNYGNDVDEEDDDDEVVASSGSITTIKKPGGDSTAIEYDDNEFKTSENNKIDEDQKSKYLSSVPKKLSGKTVKILSWWGILEPEKAKLEEFAKKTGIKYKWVQVNEGDYYSKLASMKAADNSPDLACILSQQFPTAIMMDYFRPVSDSSLDISKTDVYDINSMNYFKWDGKHYGVLIKGSTLIDFGVLFYNKDMFDKNGVKSPYDYYKENNWNWDTFLTCCHEIQNKTGKTAFTDEYAGYRMQQSSGQAHVTFSNNKIISNLGNKDYRDSWKWVDKLVEVEKVADFGLNRQGFMSGKCAMNVEESWALQKGERYEDISFTYGYVPLPSPKGVKTTIPSTAKLWGFPVGSKNIEAASYLLEYWQSPTYNIKGKEMWTNDSAANFVDWLWEQPKLFDNSKGIVAYGGDYSHSSFVSELSYLSGYENVESNADKWSAVIEANIKKIMSDWG